MNQATLHEIPNIADKSTLDGRHKEISEIVNFINGKDGFGKKNNDKLKNRKYYIVHGFKGSGASEIIKHSI